MLKSKIPESSTRPYNFGDIVIEQRIKMNGRRGQKDHARCTIGF